MIRIILAVTLSVLLSNCGTTSKLDYNIMNAQITRLTTTNACVNCDLRGANLQGMNLARADLRGINLAGANLREVNLARADLQSANLRGANLRGANLAGANLVRASLWDANLFETTLYPFPKFCRTEMQDSTIRNNDCNPV